MAKRIIETFRDGRRGVETLFEPLAEGEQGNWQTLKAMARIVSEDRSDPELREFVMRDIVAGVAGHDRDDEIDACFTYARDRITYRQDPWGIERVVDMRSLLTVLDADGEPEGDCGIKSTFFSTAVAILGYRPAFVIAKQFPDQTAYNHIYAAVMDDDGNWQYYDPTPEDAPPGWHIDAYDTRIYDIFSEV